MPSDQSEWSTVKDLVSHNSWQIYLTKAESIVFESAARTQTTWDLFNSDPWNLINSIHKPLIPTKIRTVNSTQFTIFARIRSMVSEHRFTNLSKIDCPPGCKRRIFPLYNESNESDLQKYVPIDDIYHLIELDPQMDSHIDIIQRRNKYVDLVGGVHASNETILIEKLLHEKTEPLIDTVVLVDVEDGKKPHEFVNILKVLARNVHESKLPDFQKLLMDCRPSQSKWASDERVGQEQLYDSLEKVLSGLKNFVDHSLPFLKPVQKKDAPNYYDHIRNPMDLGTMAKNMKLLLYTSKSQFKADLDLIWNNCLAYNTISESIYRTHAFAMGKLAEELLMNVADIKIRNATDDLSDESDDDSKSGIVVSKMGSAYGTLADLAASSPVESLTSPKERIENPTIIIAPDLIALDDSIMESELAVIENSDAMDITEERFSADADIAEFFYEETDDEDDFSVQVWKRRSFDMRLQLARERLKRNLTLFSDRPSLQRTEFGMARFVAAHQRFEKRNNARIIMLEDDGEEEVFNDCCIPELLHLVDSVPMNPLPEILSGSLVDFFYDDHGDFSYIPPAPMPSMSEYPNFTRDSKTGCTRSIMHNISRMADLKKWHGKIIDLQNSNSGIQDVQLPRTGQLANEYARLYTQPNILPRANTMDSYASRHILGKTCALICAAHGFDSISTQTLDVLTDVLAHHLQTLGMTLRYYIERINADLASKMSDTEILLHVLADNGLQDPGRLGDYINEDIFKYGSRVKELGNRLQYAYSTADSLPGVTGEMDIEDQGDQIMSGNCFSEIGLDLLGMREFGLDIFSVPLSIWNLKASRKLRNARLKRIIIPDVVEGTLIENKTYAAIPAWNTIDPEYIIGILKPFYATLKIEEGGMEEDEFKSPKETKLLNSRMLVKQALSGRKKAVVVAGEESKPRKKIEAKLAVTRSNKKIEKSRRAKSTK